MLRLCSEPREIQRAADEARKAGKTIGFVPTMGALHEGHASLLRRARVECEVVFASIYVNPKQFAPSEDLSRYPRPFTADRAMCEACGVDVLMQLSDADMYPRGFETVVEVDQLASRLDGAARPGHFRGVTTIVAKLFNLAKPHRAYFGQKDAQQVLIIRRMVRDLNIDVDVVVCPTVREPDGLAMSSRNGYLKLDERAQAVALSRGLAAAEVVYQAGERDAAVLIACVRDALTAAPLATIDYVELVDLDLLQPVGTIDPAVGALLAIAARFPSARLIDNTILGNARTPLLNLR